MSLKPWAFIAKQTVLATRIFRVDEETWRSPRTGRESQFAVVSSPDWVNVVALDARAHLLLIRQFRFGTGHFTLEVPGGMVEPGEDPRVTAERELREETGYSAAGWVDLGFIEPNPAIFNNKAHMFLAEGCTRTQELELDPGEDIEVVPTPVEEALRKLHRGEINHALVAVALSRFAAYREGLLDLGPVTK
jgi:8-oxo-dGTP pyrophosphatase MutT (NUDIX family)